MQRDVHQAAGDLATAVPYETAATLWGSLRGSTVSRERMHTGLPPGAEGLRGVEGAPSREDMTRRVAPGRGRPLAPSGVGPGACWSRWAVAACEGARAPRGA